MNDSQLLKNVRERDRDYAEALITARRPRIQDAPRLERQAAFFADLVRRDDMALLVMHLPELEAFLDETRDVYQEFS